MWHEFFVEAGDWMDKVIPIGTEFFAKLRENNYYFVDKTTFLSEFFRGHNDVTLITRPRRFGKTMLLSMTQQFLDIEGAEEHRNLFEGLQVMDDPVAMAEQGTRPVVFLTLKGWAEDTWEDMAASVAWYLGQLYEKFSFLAQDQMGEADRRTFEAIRQGDAPVRLLNKALAVLCQLLEAHYGRKAVLLIDEYDAPLQCAWSHGYYKDAIGFYRNFFSAALKSNPSLDFAILTGVLRIAKESIFSGLNNLDVSTVMRGGFATACGYTKEEVAKLAHDFGHEDKLAEAAAWYDGYNFQGVDIYNPWSVNNYFKYACKAEPYWVNTSGNSILQTMLAHVDKKRARDLLQLVEGQTVRAVLVDDAFIYKDIEQHRANLYALLLATGYLKYVGETQEDEVTAYDLCLPNRELRSVFRREIMRSLAYPEGEDLLFTMLTAMQEGDTEIFEEALQKVLRYMVSYHDAAHPESFYHGLMLGLTVWLERRYRIQSNRESGYGRFDIAFFPKQTQLPGLLLELKAVATEAELNDAAAAACQQIEDKAYWVEFTAADVTNVWRYGIAFCKKRVVIQAGK